MGQTLRRPLRCSPPAADLLDRLRSGSLALGFVATRERLLKTAGASDIEALVGSQRVTGT